MKRLPLKSVGILAVALLLASLGVYNIVLKATWTLLDDGVFWRDAGEGVVAGRVAAGGPAAQAGVRLGDVLLALDGEEVLAAAEVQRMLDRRPTGSHVIFRVLVFSEVK
jgi:S1-C subfamily serine protease